MTHSREGFYWLRHLMHACSEELDKRRRWLKPLGYARERLRSFSYCHAAPTMALAFATSSIGAHHKDGWVISWEVKVGRERYNEVLSIVADGEEEEIVSVHWF